MDAELKRKWVEALRSGDYAQCRGSLTEHGKSFCCLGVLAHIQSIDVLELSPHDLLDPDDAGGLSHLRQGVLADMNDGNNGQPPSSFKQIADYIEQNL